MIRLFALLSRLAPLSLAAPALADTPKIEAVEYAHLGAEQWRFAVTVRHADEGWDHYADLWVVETLEGERLGERVLAHPHVDEQPFTRSTQIMISPEITRVQVIARDSKHGFGAPLIVNLQRAETETDTQD